MPQPALNRLARPSRPRPSGPIHPQARSPPLSAGPRWPTRGRPPPELHGPPQQGGSASVAHDHEQQVGEAMRRLGIVAVLATLLMAVSASAALAVAPTEVIQTGGLHVCEGTALDVSAGSTGAGKFLTATGEVCGAGRTATATLSATATATVGCVTRGGGTPSGLEEVATATAAREDFPTRQGRGSFDVSTEPLNVGDFDFACPSAQQTEVLVGPITFTDVTLTITSQTGTITATFPDIDP
jgi:hypothetical protein